MTREEFRSITGGVKVQSLHAFVGILRATNEHNHLRYACAAADGARKLSLAMMLDSYRHYKPLDCTARTALRKLMRERCSFY